MYKFNDKDVADLYDFEDEPGSVTAQVLENDMEFTKSEAIALLTGLVARRVLVERKGKKWIVGPKGKETYWPDHLKHYSKPDIY